LTLRGGNNRPSNAGGAVMWIKTVYGAVSERFIVRIERDNGGTLFHLVDGSTARSNLLFDIDDSGQLVMIDLDDDDSDSDVPF
jgi:hypothetical protein